MKSFQYWGWLAKATPALSILLSLQFIKLTADNVCNTADLALKNIIAPTELLTQSVTSFTTLLELWALLLPVFILAIIFCKAST